jgi:hypothetical protein
MKGDYYRGRRRPKRSSSSLEIYSRVMFSGIIFSSTPVIFCVWGGGGQGSGYEKSCWRQYRALQDFYTYTLYVTRFGTCKIA